MKKILGFGATLFIFVILLFASVASGILGILVFIFAIGVILVADYWVSRNLKKINNRIATESNYLESTQTRELCQIALNQIACIGPFTLIQISKIKKALSRYSTR